MAAYADYDAATLTALIGEKLKEVSAMQAALAKLLKKGAGSVSGSSEKKKRTARGPIAWTEWTREVREMFPKYWAKWMTQDKPGTVVEFAAAMKAKKSAEYAEFEAAFKAKQAAAKAAADSDSSDEEVGSKKSSKSKASSKGGAGAGAGSRKAAALVSDSSSSDSSDSSDSSSDEEEVAPPPKKLTKPKAPVSAATLPVAAPLVVTSAKRSHAPVHATVWNFGGQAYYKTADGGVWEVDLDDDGAQILGDWCGVYVASEDRIDNTAEEPATKPLTM